MKKIYITDCEGPISKNDNAFELAERLIPEGAALFTLISKYDDIQSELVKRPGYRPGDTLKLILPFLKAYGATNDLLKRLSIADIRLVPGAKETLSFVRKLMPTFIVSTSYEQYIQALCELTDFPISNAYSTKLDLDRFRIPDEESHKLRRWVDDLVKMPVPKIPTSASSTADLARTDQETIMYLDNIFWSEMQEMHSGIVVREVRPIGGEEKAQAVKDIIERNSSSPDQVIYIGDSITDAAPLRYVRKNYGLAVSFNGNEYAIKEAELAVLSGNTLATCVLAAAFNKGGRKSVSQLVSNWSYEKIEETVGGDLRSRAEEVYKDKLPIVEMISDDNRARLIDESCSFRKKVRGEAVGSLG